MATNIKIAPGGQCPECNGRIDTTAHERVCGDCGLVVEETPIDHGRTWEDGADGQCVAADKPGDRSLVDEGMGSEIGEGRHGDVDWSRRKRINGHGQDKTARNRGYCAGEVRRIVSQLALDDMIREQALQLVTTLYDEGGLLGKDLDTIAATCVYTTTRVHQRGLSPGEVAAVGRDVTPKILGRRHTWLCDELGLACPPPSVAQRIRVVAREADAPDGVRDKALQRWGRIDDREVSGSSPSALAATLLYEASDEHFRLTQQELGEAAGVTPTTIRQCRDRLPEAEGQQSITDY